MKKLLLLSFTLLTFFACKNESTTDSKPAEKSAAPANIDNSISLPQGFKAYVFAEKLGEGARHLAVNAKGDVYVQLHTLFDGKGIAALRDTNGDGQADVTAYFGSNTGTGMDIQGNFLYCSSDDAVFRYELKADSLLPDENSRVLLVGGFPKQNEHASKSLTLDGKGSIYVNIGAPSNACQVENRSAGSPGQDPCPLLDNHAGIWRFDANKIAQQAKDGKRYASGIRNAVALTWNTQTNGLFVVQHGRDQLSEFWPKLYTNEQNAELPAEEFFQVNEGDFLGWPYCYFDPMQNKKVLAPEYGGDGKKTGRCEQAKNPIVAFPAHMAPNDVIFYNGSKFPAQYQNGAFIAFHGSWNRSPQEQKGYFVVFVPFKDGKVSGEWQVFADGFAGVKPVPSPSDAKHRPCGLAIGPDGALYVSDSVEGKIWKIVYQG
ncbi:MAG: PQQ-dependent sugar dehydrogenase [Saprospiraceae bacterium]|nr:PQQ-dependent sugar dehydrogenase [Saprospiraceae bacterium]